MDDFAAMLDPAVTVGIDRYLWATEATPVQRDS
jgi:hypothetical protein